MRVDIRMVSNHSLTFCAEIKPAPSAGGQMRRVGGSRIQQIDVDNGPSWHQLASNLEAFRSGIVRFGLAFGSEFAAASEVGVSSLKSMTC